MKLLLHFTIIALLCIVLSCGANKTNNTVTKTSKPLSDTAWVHAINDSTANYYTTVANFEAFWKDKRKPVLEKDLFNSEYKVQPISANEPAAIYALQYKKFIHWQQEVLPYVQPNGSILTMSQIIALHYKQHKK